MFNTQESDVYDHKCTVKSCTTFLDNLDNRCQHYLVKERDICKHWWYLQNIYSFISETYHITGVSTYRRLIKFDMYY